MLETASQQIKELTRSLNSLNYQVIHEEVIENKDFHKLFYKEFVLPIFEHFDFDSLYEASLEKANLYRNLAYACIRKSTLGLKEPAVEFLKKLFFIYLIQDQLLDAYISLPSMHVIGKEQRTMLEKIWWEAWLKSQDFEIGMKFINEMPKVTKYERQFIYLLEKRFGRGFNDLILEDYKDNWHLLPYPQYSFLMWLTGTINFNFYGYNIRRLLRILINDPFLLKVLNQEANLSLNDYDSIPLHEKYLY